MSNKKTIVFLLIILALAAFFRFWQLNQIPPGLYPDVAMNGTDAIDAMESGDYRMFYPDNNGREGFFMNLIALNFKYFGVSILNIKIVAAIFGWLTILGMFLLTRELFSRLKSLNKANLLALLVAFFMAVSFWHVNFSRLGFRAIVLPFCLVWCFYFLFKAAAASMPDDNFGGHGEWHPNPNSQNTNDAKPRAAGRVFLTITYWLLAGIFFGLGFHTYISFRVAPLILAPIFIFSLIAYWPRLKILVKERKILGNVFKNFYFKDGWYGWDIFLFTAILVALPLIFYFGQNPADFMGRTGQVSVLSSANPLQGLIASTIKTLGQFVAVGDFNWRHNIAGSPQIFWPLIPFFIWGFLYSAWQIFRQKNYRADNFMGATIYWTLLIWWGVMLLPSILTNEGLPHALRSIGSIPPAYIFTGLGAFMFIKFLHRLLQSPRLIVAANILIILSLAALAGAEYWRYFIYWGQNETTRSAFTQLFVDEANYLNSLPATTQKYVIVNAGGVPVPYPGGPMVAKAAGYLVPVDSAASAAAPFFAFPDGPKVILPMNYDQQIFEALEIEFSTGEIKNINNNFLVFEVNQ
ncbi:MAG: hypothetical protein UV36_C0037G0006 [Parcubacteria group bacterium GW2011_GWC2_42_6]|nr:MAG: hypothetical protein UV36_C0037G0006 [Parcubacteria group bacterium GW2011_GWC2_42_6]